MVFKNVNTIFNYLQIFPYDIKGPITVATKYDESTTSVRSYPQRGAAVQEAQ